MKAVFAFFLLATGIAQAQERWFEPRLWLRAFAHHAAAMIVEPQSGFWPEGVWLNVALDGAVAELPPPEGCLWTAMALNPLDGRRAAAAFCPAPACDDARSVLWIDDEILWAGRSLHLADLVWSADGQVVGGVLSVYEGARAQSLRSLGVRRSCVRRPIEVAEFGSGEAVSGLPALLPSSTSGLRLRGHDGVRWLAEIGYSGPGAFISHPPIAVALEAYCAARRAAEFGRPCGSAVGAALARIDGDDADAVLLGGGPVTARTLVGPGAAFFVSESCEVERLSHRRIRSRCDLLRWDPPFEAARPLTSGGAVLGGLALSGDGRIIAALNPFAGAGSSLTLIDAQTGAAQDLPVGDWIRAAFAATGRTRQMGDEE